MSTFKIISEIFENSEWNFSELDKAKIIRIEKTLKARQKLEGDISTNQIQEIVSILKNDRKNIAVLFQSQFAYLRDIIAAPHLFINFEEEELQTGVIDGDFKYFLEQFSEELRLYADNCLNADHYYALNSFLNFRDLLSEDILDYIINRLISKLDYGNEVLELWEDTFSEKINYLLNPYFYRCCNSVGTIFMEHDVVRVYSAGLNLKSKPHFYRFVLAAASFEHSNQELAEFVSSNKTAALSQGASELEDETFDHSFKGGTIHESLFNLSDRDLADLKEIAEGPSAVKSFFLVVALILLIVRAISGFSEPKLKSLQPALSQNEAFNNQLSPKFFLLLGFSHEDILYNQYVRGDFVVFEPCDFKIENTSYSEITKPSKKASDYELFNTTAKNIIVISVTNFSQIQYNFLSSGSSVSVPALAGRIKLYTGTKPESTITTSPSDVDFRFGIFTKTDSLLFRNEFDLSEIKTKNKKYMLVPKDGTIDVQPYSNSYWFQNIIFKANKSGR